MRIYSCKKGRKVEWFAESDKQVVIATEQRGVLGDYVLHDLEAIYKVMCKVGRHYAYTVGEESGQDHEKMYILVNRGLYKLLSGAKRDEQYIKAIDRVYKQANYSRVAVEIIQHNGRVAQIESLKSENRCTITELL